MTVTFRGGLLLISVASLCTAGCGSSDLRQPTFPVTGSVLIDGKPLPEATVVFHALDKTNFKWQELPQAKTDADGKFTVFTYENGDGAPAGEYKVGIALLEPVADDGGDQVMRHKNKFNLAQKYSDPEKSGITAKVSQGSNALPPFNVSSK